MNMHHNLDIHPIPEEVLYINDPTLADLNLPYETDEQMDKVKSGVSVSKGGILPDDNIRVYIPLDLSFDSILRRLNNLYSIFGEPDEQNESAFTREVYRIVCELEIYDQVWTVRELRDVITIEGKLHSKRGAELAKEMVRILEEHEGNAELFPFETIDELKKEYCL